MRALQNYEQNLVSGGEDDDEEIVVTAPLWTDADELEYLSDMGCTQTVATSNTVVLGFQVTPTGPGLVVQVQNPASTMTCPVGVMGGRAAPPAPRDPFPPEPLPFNNFSI
jgi:hypothetical protein